MLVPGASGEKTQLLDGAQVDHISENTVGHGVSIQGRTNGVTIDSTYVGYRLVSQTARASAIALTSTVTVNAAAGITLTPGVWLVFGVVGFVGISQAVTSLRAEISTVSATLNNPPSGYTGTSGFDASNSSLASDTDALNLNNGDITLALPTITQNISSNVTLYPLAFSNFSSGTASAYGHIEAVRIA